VYNLRQKFPKEYQVWPFFWINIFQMHEKDSATERGAARLSSRPLDQWTMLLLSKSSQLQSRPLNRAPRFSRRRLPVSRVPERECSDEARNVSALLASRREKVWTNHSSFVLALTFRIRAPHFDSRELYGGQVSITVSDKDDHSTSRIFDTQLFTSAPNTHFPPSHSLTFIKIPLG
jgi:hypothetical protein